MKKNPKIPLLGNRPTVHAHQNPYEVRSASGLEGVFADRDDAEFHASELRREGVPGVIVEHRRRIGQGQGGQPRANPSSYPPSSTPGWQVSRSITNMQDGIGFLGGDGFAATRYYKHIGVDVDGVGHGWLERCYNDTCLIELVDGRVEAFPASQVWAVSGRYPERPRAVARRAARGNPVDPWAMERAALAKRARLFVGVYPTGIVYADRSREVDGDYKRVARLPFSTLQLEWEPDAPLELREEILRDAQLVIDQRGRDYPVSASGQTVRLGRGNPASLTKRWRVWFTEAPDSYVHVDAGDYTDAMRIAARSFRGAHDGETRYMAAKIDGGRMIEQLVTVHHGGRLTFHRDK